MKKQNFSDELEVRDLCDIACEIRNLPKGSLTIDSPRTCKSRKQKYTLPRSVVSNIARLHGRIHPEIIADVLGKHRTSIYAYKRIHEGLLNSWEDYRFLFEKILNRYSEIKKSKLKFKDPEELINHIREAGVLFSNKPSAFIEIKTRDFSVIINTDLRDCGTNLEIIRVALNSYEFDSLKLNIDEKYIK